MMNGVLLLRKQSLVQFQTYLLQMLYTTETVKNVDIVKEEAFENIAKYFKYNDEEQSILWEGLRNKK